MFEKFPEISRLVDTMYIRNFIQIEQWESGQIYGENFTGRGKFGGRISKKKVTNFHPYQKMVKFRGKIFWGGISQRGGGK